MASAFLGSIPVAAVLGLMFAAYSIVLWRKSVRERRRRNPLTRKLMRSPGASLRKEVDDLTLEIAYCLLLAAYGPLLMYTVHLTQSYLVGVPESVGRIVVSLVGGGGVFLYLLIKLMRLWERRARLALGLDGELAVGEELNQLMKKGFSVFHDFPTDRFNIDHIVVGPTGVFAVETKARSKRIRGQGDESAKVYYDGEALRFPDHAETKPIEQARRQARWLGKWLSSAVGEPVDVKPVVALPGWYVERTSKHDVLIYNGGRPELLFPKVRGTALSPDMAQRIRHQLEQRCRDVEPHGLRKEQRHPAHGH